MKYLLLVFVMPFIIGCGKSDTSEDKPSVDAPQQVDLSDSVTPTSAATPTGD